jgi:sigma-E factor negative regulatory protein RseB
MDARPRPAASGTGPGTEPPALWLITAAVVAGLIVTGMTVARAGHPVRQRTAAVAGAAQGGMKLLARAAQACHAVPFHGVALLDWRGGEGSAASESEVEVWHARGGRPLMRPAVVQPSAWLDSGHRTAPSGATGSAASLEGDGMLGLSPRLVGLLGRNYQLVVVGWGQVAGRPARIVTARRPGGRVAARFWLDKATYLPLRRQVFDPSGRVISDVAFSSVRFGRSAVTQVPGPAARPWDNVLTSAQLARLRDQGWPLPEPPPGDLALLGARQDTSHGAPVVELDYSDGLSVVSVFVQRGHLPARLSGWQPAVVRGYRVYTDDADGNGVVWSARGFVYTVIADAPAQTLAQVVAALPHHSPGMLDRIRHGLDRLVSWLRF